MSRRHAQTRDEKHRPPGNARCGRVRTPSDPGWRPRYRACRTSDRRGSPALHGRSIAPSGSQRHTLQSASGSSAPDQSTDDPPTNSGCKFAAKPGQIESGVDLPRQMIFGYRVAKMKLVEQLALVNPQTAHRGSTSPRFASTQRNQASRPVSNDFCNKICQVPKKPTPRWPRVPTKSGNLIDSFYIL
jgi:hypothetical protein